MKTFRTLTALLIFVSSVAPALGQLNMDSLKQMGGELLKQKAGEIAVNEVLDAVMGEGQAGQLAGQVVQALQNDQFRDALGLFSQAKGLKLTPEQVAVWNILKNEAAAYIVKQEFDYESSAIKPQIDAAVAALRTGDTAAVGKTLAKVAQASKLSPEQMSLLMQIRQQAGPLISTASSLFAPKEN